MAKNFLSLFFLITYLITYLISCLGLNVYHLWGNTPTTTKEQSINQQYLRYRIQQKFENGIENESDLENFNKEIAEQRQVAKDIQFQRKKVKYTSQDRIAGIGFSPDEKKIFVL